VETKQLTNAATSEVLVLPDGQILVHNLTPGMAELLAALNPADPTMRDRAQALLCSERPTHCQNPPLD
jgi:hypothetical protein